MSMKRAIKRMWVRALKSGKYTQGREQLRDDNTKSHCCLGVLTDLYCKRTKRGWNPVTRGSSLTLPEKVQKWAGLTKANPVIRGRSASSWNDTKKASFDRIARLIESDEKL